MSRVHLSPRIIVRTTELSYNARPQHVHHKVEDYFRLTSTLHIRLARWNPLQQTARLLLALKSMRVAQGGTSSVIHCYKRRKTVVSL